MTVAHIVSFKLQRALSESTDAKHEIIVNFLNLKTACLKDGAPYILDLCGGEDVSIEGQSKGFDISFIVTFASLTDRDYYLDECPTHKAFANKIKRQIEDHYVFDFEY